MFSNGLDSPITVNPEEIPLCNILTNILPGAGRKGKRLMYVARAAPLVRMPVKVMLSSVIRVTVRSDSTPLGRGAGG